MRFHLTIMRPQTDRGRFFTQAFNEVTETLAYGLLALGHQVSHKANGFLVGAQNIVLGPHLASSETEFPDGTILYNLEQIGGHPAANLSDKLLQRCRVWDYSTANMKYWQEHGIEAEYVPVGYVRELTRIPPAAHQDIDVLFYGVLSPRRAAIIEQLKQKGLNVAAIQTFGWLRDKAIAQSKVVLNMHYYDSPKLFEWVRVSYLLSNLKAVVSEISDDFPEVFTTALRNVPYEDLAEACRDLVAKLPERLALQTSGFQIFSQIREVEILRKTLAACPAKTMPGILAG
jgi:hypothetical protein